MVSMLKNIENHNGTLGVGSKRTADVMLQSIGSSPVMSPSVETASSDTQSDTENYNRKRPRLNGDTDVIDSGTPPKINPSKVLHIRNLPQDTSETEIMVLATPFGNVTNIILMRNKRQAFVEMGDIHQAQELVNRFQNPTTPASIRGQSVQVQYSATYSELKPGQRSHASGMKPTPVLHVNIENAMLPVTLPLLHQVFSKYGIVEKIITFNKNNQLQALIQMSDVTSAQVAKGSLDGKNVYPNCCTLRIDFSKMLSVNVRYNNEKSRDFTNPNLPSSDDPNGVPPLPPSSTGHRARLPTAAGPPRVPYGSRLSQPATTIATQVAMGSYNPLAQVAPSVPSAMAAYRMVNGFGPQQVMAGAPPNSLQPPVNLVPQAANQLPQLTVNQLQLLQHQQQLSLQQQQSQQSVAAAQIHMQQQLAAAMACQLQGQGQSVAMNPALAQLSGIPQYMQSSRGSSLASVTTSSASQDSLSPEHNVLSSPSPAAAANQQLQLNATAALNQHYKQQRLNGDNTGNLTTVSNPVLLVSGLNAQVGYQSAKPQ